MSKASKINANKEARFQIAEQLQLSLPGLIDLLGQEEFDKRIKKAAKLLADGIQAPRKKKKQNSPKKVKEKETVKAA